MRRMLSLLYPVDFAGAQDSSRMDFGFLEELRIDDLVVPLMSKGPPWKSRTFELARFFTSDAAVIRHRLDVLEDLVNNPELCSTLGEVLPLIEDMVEVSGGRATASDVTACLYAASELELYVDCTDALYGTLESAQTLRSAGWIQCIRS